MDNFIGLANKYGWEHIELRAATANIHFLSKVEQIYIADMKIQLWGYFVTQGIVNKNTPVPYPLAAHNPGNNFGCLTLDTRTDSPVFSGTIILTITSI